MTMSKRTALYDCHLKAGAKMVDFAGFDMPLHYGSQIEEHQQVRTQAGVFDVSHMGVIDITGPQAADYLRYLLANNIDRLSIGCALYTCLLNDRGGILDDLIVYQLSSHYYRLVVNAGTRDKDFAWMKQQAARFDVVVTACTDLSMLAIQGRAVRDKISRLLIMAEAEQLLQLKPFTFAMYKDILVARTGYTGEEGFEVIFPSEKAQTIWEACLLFGIKPCGLGARDTLRLEAGLNLYGADMDETVTPFESNLAWTVALEPSNRYFIGRAALEDQLQRGVSRQLIGLVLETKGIMRPHQSVFYEGQHCGEITSGSYAPTLQQSIALARLATPVTIGAQCTVAIRDKQLAARIVKPPFVRKGQRTYETVLEGVMK